MARFNSKDILLIGLKGDKGEKGDTPYIGENGNWWIGDEDTGISASGGSNITVDSELSTESENPVQNKVITENFENYVKKRTDSTTGYNVYGRVNKSEMLFPVGNLSSLTANANGVIPSYTYQDGSSQLFTGMPTIARSCTNKKYVDENFASKEEVENAEAIAKGRATGYVFDTLEDLDTWLTDSANIEKLVLGDNLYIRATDVPDYWWDGTQKQQLETQKVDLTNYVKNTDYATLGKAGVVKVDTSYRSVTGIAIDNGRIMVSYPTNTNIKDQQLDNQAIVASKLAFAVKCGLAYPENAKEAPNWTDEERTKARTTIGATALYKHTVTFSIVETGAIVYITYYSFNTDTTFGIPEPPYLFIDEEDVLSPPIVTINGLLNPKTMWLRDNYNNSKLQYAMAINDMFGGESVTIDGESISHSYVAV